MHQLGIVKVELYPFRVQKIAIGQIAYNEDASTVVLSPFSGRVTRLIAKIGDKVKPGDPLLEIDSTDVLQPQNDYIAALGAVNKARSQLELAKIAESRHKGLFEARPAPSRNGSRRRPSSSPPRTTCVRPKLRSRLRAPAPHHWTDRRGDRGAEGAGHSRATVIPAPIDGTVIARKVGPGQYVRSDIGDPLYAIADLSTMWLKAHVPENDIPLVRVGQEIEVRVTALPDRVFKARITAIGAASDATTRRVVVRSEIPNPDGALKSEMFASFRIATGDGEPSPAVPVEAVIREGDQAVVWVEQEPLVFQRRKVKLGIEQDGRCRFAKA